MITGQELDEQHGSNAAAHEVCEMSIRLVYGGNGLDAMIEQSKPKIDQTMQDHLQEVSQHASSAGSLATFKAIPTQMWCQQHGSFLHQQVAELLPYYDSDSFKWSSAKKSMFGGDGLVLNGPDDFSVIMKRRINIPADL